MSTELLWVAFILNILNLKEATNVHSIFGIQRFVK